MLPQKNLVDHTSYGASIEIKGTLFGAHRQGGCHSLKVYIYIYHIQQLLQTYHYYQKENQQRMQVQAWPDRKRTSKVSIYIIYFECRLLETVSGLNEISILIIVFRGLQLLRKSRVRNWYFIGEYWQYQCLTFSFLASIHSIYSLFHFTTVVS